jgi:hypothetical protein
MRQHDERDLRTALREEADRHRPDRQAMLDRIAQGRAPSTRRPVDRALALLRPAAAALAVAVVLVLAVAGVRLGSRGPDVDDTPVAATPTPSATPAPTPSAAPKPSTATATTTPPKPPRTSTGTTSTPGRTTPATTAPVIDRDGFVSSTARVDPGSNNGWAQSNVVLTTTRELTALEVTVEIALTPGVAFSGKWSTLPENVLDITYSTTNKMLIYRFILRPGNTIAPGKYTFAVQYSHTPGKRSAADDGYVARVTGEDKDAKVSGGFMPQ